MRVFNAFFKIVKKNVPALLLYFMIFAVLIIMFSHVGNVEEVEDFTQTRMPVAVIDHDGSNVSQSIAQLMHERHDIKELQDTSKQSIIDALYNRKVEYVVTIPSGYGQQLSQHNKVPKLDVQTIPGSFAEIYVTQLLDTYIHTAKTYIDAGIEAEKAVEYAQKDMQQAIKVDYRQQIDEKEEGIIYYYNFQSYAIFMMIILGIGTVLISFHKRPVAQRTEASALSLAARNTQIGIGMALLAVICLALLVMLGLIMYGANMFKTGALICLLNAICYSIFSVSLAFLLGMLCKSGNVLSAAANALGLTMSFIGGVFVPRSVMNPEILKIAQFTPAYWYADVIEKISNQGLDASMTSDMAMSLGIQLLFAAALIAVGLVVSKYKRKRV